MTLIATARSVIAVAVEALAAPRQKSHLLPLFLHFGLLGVFLVSIVDSSFVPLPIPGVTDVMILVLAAEHARWMLLVGIATLGSAIGGYISHQVGRSGGMTFLKKKIPARIFDRVCKWMESHAILSVALPAILPPPIPLSPFVLAAGALNMSRRKFMTTFTISRGLRHLAAVWLGIHYGAQVLHVWNHFSRKWTVTILVVLWTGILISSGIAIYKLYRTSRDVRIRPKPQPEG